MENPKSAVVSSVVGAIFSFAASLEWLSFAKELGIAFLFGFVGAVGGLLANLLWNKLKSKYGKTNQK